MPCQVICWHIHLLAYVICLHTAGILSSAGIQLRVERAPLPGTFATLDRAIKLKILSPLFSDRFAGVTRCIAMSPLPFQVSKSHRNISLRAMAILAIGAYAFFMAAPASAQSNALTLPRNVGQLVDESHTVLQGWVASVALEPHPQLKNLMTVVVTLQVEEALKGEAVKTYTFSQAVIDKRDVQEKMGYRVGQHLLLILIKSNSYGLSSTAGMEQGRFRINAGGPGKLLATNGFGNAGLFRGLDSQLQSKGLRVPPEVQTMLMKSGTGPVPLEQLKSLIRTIAAADSTK